MTITRTRIRCRERACPWRDDWDFHQIPWCRGIEGHKCFGGVTHQHHPKRSQGGKEIVALLCSGAHDIIDNGSRFSNDVIERDGQRIYRILHEKRGVLPHAYSVLYERVLGVAATPGGKTTEPERIEPAGVEASLPSGAAPAPSDGGEGQYGKALLPSGESPGTAEASPPSPGARAPEERVGRKNENSRVLRTETPPSSLGEPRQHPADCGECGGTGVLDSGGFQPWGEPINVPCPGPREDSGAITPPSSLDWDSWAERGKAVRYWVSATPWAFGDWANLGEDHFGEKAWDEITEGFDRRDFQKVRNWMWVAKSIPPTERVHSLSWSHHRLVAHLPPSNRTALLRRAAAEGWTRDRLSDELPATQVAKAKPDVAALAWTAGVIDGEGCVDLDQGYPRLQVVNTDIRLCEQLKALWGGRLCKRTDAGEPEHWKRRWYWAISGHQARSLIEQIRRYLIVKGEKADEVLGGKEHTKA